MSRAVQESDGAAKKITVVGCGPGGPEYITPAALEAIENADVLVGARRVLDLLPAGRAERILVGADIVGALDEIARRVGRHRIVIAVSGDPGVCSLAQPVIRRFGAGACTVIPGITSVQVAFARIGMDWFDAKLVSCHDGIPNVDVAALEASDKIAVLAGNPATLGWVRAVAAALKGSHTIIVCENLTMHDEQVRRVSADDFMELALPSRTIVLFIRRRVLA